MIPMELLSMGASTVGGILSSWHKRVKMRQKNKKC